MKSHLSRAHKKTGKSEIQATFCCNLCDFKNLCSAVKFIAHLRNHLKQHVSVACPFKTCDFASNVLSSFSSHVSRKHKTYTVDDFKQSVRSQITPSNLSEEEDSFVEYDIQPAAVCFEKEGSSYLEPVNNSTIESKLASLYLYMQTSLHISKSAAQEVISGFSDILSFSKYTARQSIRDIFKKIESIDGPVAEELTESILESIHDKNPILLATTERGCLSTDYRRTKYFKEHFHGY